MSTFIAVGTRVEIEREHVLKPLGKTIVKSLSAKQKTFSGTVGTKERARRKWPVTLDDAPSKIIHIRRKDLKIMTTPVAASASAAADAAPGIAGSSSSSAAAAAASSEATQHDTLETVEPELAIILSDLFIEVVPPDEMSESSKITLKIEDPQAAPRKWSAPSGKYAGVQWWRNKPSGFDVPLFRSTTPMRARRSRSVARMGCAAVEEHECGPKNLPRDFACDSPPIDYFNLYNSPTFRRDVVLLESLRYAKQTGMGVTRYGASSHNPYVPLSFADINSSFACLIYNGVKKSPRFRCNWYGHAGLVNPAMKAAQSFPRWQHFWSAFHLADNEADHGDRAVRQTYDHLWKIRPALDHFRSNCVKYWEPGEFGSIDETTRRIGAHCSPLIKSNCRKYKDEGDGIQFESYGDGSYLVDFLWRHDPRLRRSKTKNTELQLPEIGGPLGSAITSETSRRVLRLLHRVNQLSPWRGRHVYVDNLYSDYGLFVAARDEYGTKMTGTCRANRGGRPEHILQEKLTPTANSTKRAAKKGTTLWATTEQGVVAASIYDTVPVYFLSTGYDRPACFYKDRGKFLNPLPKFRLQDDFNNRMCFVDRVDGRVACYRTDRIVSSKWWISPALWALIDGPSANAFSLHEALCERNEEKKMDRLDFQMKIADGLVEEAVKSRKHRRKSPKKKPDPIPKRRKVGEPGGRRARNGKAQVAEGGCTRRIGKIHSNPCQCCRSKSETMTYTSLQCIDCNLALCVECFNLH